MKPIYRALAGLFLALGLAAHGAEIRVEPEVQTATHSDALPKAKQGHARATVVKAIVLPAPAADVVPKDALVPGPGVPLQIGSGRDVPSLEDVAAALQWQDLPDGAKVTALSITSPGASALRAGIHVLAMPAGAMLRFYGPNETTLFEVTGQEIRDAIDANLKAAPDDVRARTWWSPVVEEPTLVLEIELPAGASTSDIQIGLPQISHLITSARTGFIVPKVYTACELDAMCYQSTWGSQTNAVARMIFTSGGSTYTCTGTLLADQDPNTSIPYFLSANHCISDAITAGTLQTNWFFNSTSCNSGATSGYQTLTGGADLLYASSNTDTSFMRLRSAPPAGVVFAGWLVSGAPASGSAVTGIHHPGGTYTRIAFGNILGFTTCGPVDPSTGMFSCGNSSSNPSGTTFLETTWTSGLTEPGSSGSGLFLNNGKYLIGQLFGGTSSCPAQPGDGDVYGRFDVAYNAALYTWLAAPATPTLTVSKPGTGVGSVTSSPAGISCGATCSASFANNTSVVLTAAAAGGSTFGGWSGACSGSAATCTVTVAGATAVSATFYSLQTLTVSRTGTGTGTITSSPSGISCGATCSSSFFTGTSVTLTATPAAGQFFLGWSGACSGTGMCTVTMNAAQSATANFSLTAPPSITVTPTAGILVTSSPWALYCGTNCTTTFAPGTVVTLTATSLGTPFTGWGGACSGTATTCTLTVNGPLSVTTNPANPPPPPAQTALTVALAGTGTGSVASTPAGINCGATCGASFVQGTMVSLAATPTNGSTFAGWSGACSGAGACSVTLNAASNVTATFTAAVTPPPPTYFMLSVTLAGTGTGSVVSTPAGINCGTLCSATYAQNTVVALTATPASGSTFTSWGGACSGSGACSVPMTAASGVTATFTVATPPPPPPPTGGSPSITVTPTAGILVTSSPWALYCGTNCTANFAAGSVVTLTATSLGTPFTGWAGACSGTASTCTLTVNGALSVSTNNGAVPPPPPPPAQVALTVSLAGTGSGSVASSPAGINCGATCSANFAQGSSVSLTAAPASGSTFAGWSGACSGTGACNVMMNAASSVGATFTAAAPPPPPPTGGTPSITVTPTAGIVVTSSPWALYCGTNCTANFAAGSVVTLTATSLGTPFTGWAGACSGTASTCTLTVNGALSVSTNNGAVPPPPPPPAQVALTVSLAGTGSGSVASSPAGINCGATCSANFAQGSSVSLTATPASGSTFAGWSGACSGTGACNLMMNAASSVGATFTAAAPPPPPPTGGTPSITVATSGPGSLVVTSNPWALYCGANCTSTFPAGSTVTLTATILGGTFNGWGGACSGTSPTCTLTVNGALNVTASTR